MTESTQSKYVRTAEGIAGYSPANHSGTSNQRLVSRDTVGAKYVEVLIGTIVKGHGATRHFHPSLEQAGYMFQGSGISEIDGVEKEAGPGGWRFYPKGTPHAITVTSDEPVKTIVVYAPPYAENREAAVVCEDKHSRGYAAAPLKGVQEAIAARPRFDSPIYSGARFAPIIDAEKSRADSMEVFDVQLSAGGGASRQTLRGLEQVFFVRAGRLRGTIDGEAFAAVKGDFVFIPDGAAHAYASDEEGAEAFLIRAFPNPSQE
ncbi:MAG: cupin domain-containing protein [Burkholderiaceae bacterium]